MSQITVRLCSASVAGLLQGIWDPTNLRAVQHNQVLHSRDSTAWIIKTCTTHLPTESVLLLVTMPHGYCSIQSVIMDLTATVPLSVTQLYNT
jgi:hypothetical protein